MDSNKITSTGRRPGPVNFYEVKINFKYLKKKTAHRHELAIHVDKVQRNFMK